MTTPSPLWSAARRAAVEAGRSPSAEVISDVVGTSALRLGRDGVDLEDARLTRDLLGFGDLTAALSDPTVTDVLVNGDGRVWMDRGLGMELAGVRMAQGELRPLAVRLAGLGGRRLDDAQPWADVDLPGGIRLHAVLPPLVRGGAHVSLRIPRVAPAGVDDLVRLGMVDEAMAAILVAMVASQCSFLVCGGTGTGKTTLLGGLIALCPTNERVVLVEDVAELRPSHGHVVHLQGRPANVEGHGLVTMTDLVRQALRMRPDRLVVGEVRGAEVRELLAALNVGHAGAGTVHANGVAALPARLQALGALAGLSREAVDGQVVTGLDVVLTMGRDGPTRRVIDIGVVGSEDARVVVRSAVSSPQPGTMVRGPGWDRLVEVTGLESPP